MQPPEHQFRRFLDEGRFMLQRNPSGKHVFYPHIAEPESGEPLEWVPASGRGTVHSVTVARSKPPAPNYDVALVDLAEGVRMMSRVDGIVPEAVKIGMPVAARVVVEDVAPLVVFEPAST
jgi:uncharacterized OB-fold protein